MFFTDLPITKEGWLEKFECTMLVDCDEGGSITEEELDQDTF